jgi:transposase, IS30 family
MRDMTTWFCDAYASWQKGGVENANGSLRRFLPRHLDIDRISDRESRRSSSSPTSPHVNAWGSRRHVQALLAELGKDA